MKRVPPLFWLIILSPTRVHVICVIAALIACLFILFPEIGPAGTDDLLQIYAGGTLLTAMGVSTLLFFISAAIHMLRLSNTRAFSQLLKWSTCWGCGVALYVLLALSADVQPPDTEEDNFAIQSSDHLYAPKDQLNGPASLVIPVETDNQSADLVTEAPNMTVLENEHAELFQNYIEKSPRWSGQEGDDTYYSKPGHLVMVPPTSSGAPGLVHVCFRTLVEGDRLPQGFSVVQPGGNFPESTDASKFISDVAVDLGRNHFLLLAWRGSAHRQTAYKAINAAIAAIDARMQPLRDNPTAETVTRLLNGRESYPGSTPEFRLSEPIAQEGAYQAELYANPGEAGTILVYIKELKSGRTLRLMSCPARYSNNNQELFRHDLPGSMPDWIRSSVEGDVSNLFPANTPLFAIRRGPQHQYFGVAFEVYFKPSDVRKQQRHLIRRCYKVQAYEPPVAESPAADSPKT